MYTERDRIQKEMEAINCRVTRCQSMLSVFTLLMNRKQLVTSQDIFSEFCQEMHRTIATFEPFPIPTAVADLCGCAVRCSQAPAYYIRQNGGTIEDLYQQRKMVLEKTQRILLWELDRVRQEDKAEFVRLMNRLKELGGPVGNPNYQH